VLKSQLWVFKLHSACRSYTLRIYITLERVVITLGLVVITLERVVITLRVYKSYSACLNHTRACRYHTRACQSYTCVCGNLTLRVKSHHACGNCWIFILFSWGEGGGNYLHYTTPPYTWLTHATSLTHYWPTQWNHSITSYLIKVPNNSILHVKNFSHWNSNGL
jgi:hypothetical protein